MTTQPQTVRVGIGVMIFKDGMILLGKRKGSHGSGEYAFPGGHMEYMESFTQCAQRETKEECGIEIHNIRFEYVANITDYAPKHYVHIGLIADWKSGTPEVLEKEKVESWNWYPLEKVPPRLFKPCAMAIAYYKTGQTYCDKG